ncbi:recombinase RecT [Streptomyces halobius]|uniref:Recombinase RecT n=1 Tax=Streptomyces halobius TaxID=2879846 RepID=A0ABY4MF44_9ACTN|nr:recombinase RecT [Streptomyces halobius]UQA95728.1 recombinase RecT [Streptomyces halobius]
MTSTLKDRVRAATEEARHPAKLPTARPAETVDGSTAEELHAAERQDGGETTDAVLSWLERYGEHFTKALPSHVDQGAFFAAVRAVLPGLVRCTPASLLQALLTCARFGLVPDGRHAVIRREGKLAVFVPMYQGYVELMYRSGRVGSVHVGMIHAGDEWNYEPTAPPPLDFTHKPALELTREQRGKPILAYAFCWMTGGARSQVVILTRQDAEEIRDEYSQAYQRAKAEGREDTFWHTHFDDMWKKSALRRLHKVVPMSAELVQLGKADDAGDAGQTQVLHTPDEDARLLADATAAHKAAEGSQESRQVATLPRKRMQPKRASRKSRRGGKGRRR